MWHGGFWGRCGNERRRWAPSRHYPGQASHPDSGSADRPILSRNASLKCWSSVSRGDNLRGACDRWPTAHLWWGNRNWQQPTRPTQSNVLPFHPPSRDGKRPARVISGTSIPEWWSTAGCAASLPRARTRPAESARRRHHDEVGADVERAGEQGLSHPRVGFDGLRLDADAVARDEAR